MLVGVVNAPTRYSPVRNPENALTRRNLVLSRMRHAGALTRAQYDSIAALPIVLNYQPVSHNAGTATYFREMLRLMMSADKPRRNQFNNDWDYEQAQLEYDRNPLYGWCRKNRKADGTPYDIYRDGLKIYTTLNSEMQRYAEQAVQNQMEKVIQPRMDAQYKRTKVLFLDTDRKERERIIRHAIRYSDRYREMRQAGISERDIEASFDKPCSMKVFTYKGERDTLMTPRDSILHHKRIMRAAFVAIDPHTGFVKAYVGGPNFRYFKYDMAKQGKRQIGSTIKAIRLHVRHRPPRHDALHDGAQPAGYDRNSQRHGVVAQGGGQGGAERRTQPALVGFGPQPQQLLGVDHEASQATRSRGRFHPQHGHPQLHRPRAGTLLGHLGVERIRTGERILDFRKSRRAQRCHVRHPHRRPAGQCHRHIHPQSQDAINERTAYTMLTMLQGVVNAGTAGRLNRDYGFYGVEVGGKTGTSNKNRDAWFMCVAPKIVAGAWVGGEDQAVHLISAGEGGVVALPIVGEFLKNVYNDGRFGIGRTDTFVRPTQMPRYNCDEATDADRTAETGIADDDEFFD